MPSMVRETPDCVVNAENAAEIAACSDTTLGTSLEECIVNAENAAEQAECRAYETSPLPVLGSVDEVEECIVNAENAAEIAACSDTTLGTSLEECIVNAENAAEQAECRGAAGYHRTRADASDAVHRSHQSPQSH